MNTVYEGDLIKEKYQGDGFDTSGNYFSKKACKDLSSAVVPYEDFDLHNVKKLVETFRAHRFKGSVISGWGRYQDSLSLSLRKTKSNKLKNSVLEKFGVFYYEDIDYSIQWIASTGEHVCLTSDPSQLFKPSNKLLNLIKLHSAKPDEKKNEFFKILSEQAEEVYGVQIKPSDFESLISGRIEGLFADIAEDRKEEKKFSIQISNNSRLNTEICGELIERLDLDTYDTRPVMDCLYVELLGFVSEITRERSWGEIVIKNSLIILEINPDREFKTIEIDEIDPTQWTVSR